MKNLSKKNIDIVINKVLRETLEEKANEIKSKLKNELDEKMMDDTHPTFGHMTPEELRSFYKKMKKDGINLKDKSHKPKPKNDDDEDEFPDFGFGDAISENNMCNECGSGYMEEGVCNECGGMGKTLYSESDEDIKQNKLERVCSKNSEDYDIQACEAHKKYSKEGELDEKLYGNQYKLDKNKNNKIDSDDFAMIRRGKKEETKESLKGNQKNIDKNKNGKIDSEDFKMLRKMKSKKSLKLTEDELISLIENIVNENKETKVKSNIKLDGNHPGLKKYEQSYKESGKENLDNLKSVGKKMKEYLKDGSKGAYESNPTQFPKGNGELAKMSKKAYVPSDAVKDYTDNLTAAALENLSYDEINPDEDWVSKNIEGDSKTGNNPKWANAVDTGINKKRNKIRKDNLLGKIKKMAYHKSPQPIVTDKTGENAGSKLLMKLESIENKNNKNLNEEFVKIKNLLGYNKKTQ